MGNGVVTCVSIYTNDFDSDYGEGPGAALWIDNLGTKSIFYFEIYVLFCEIFCVFDILLLFL